MKTIQSIKTSYIDLAWDTRDTLHIVLKETLISSDICKTIQNNNTNENLPIFDFYFWENLLHQRHLETTYTSWRQKILSGSIKTICILHNTFICIPCCEPFDSFHRIFYELKILQRQILTIITWSDKLVST